MVQLFYLFGCRLRFVTVDAPLDGGPHIVVDDMNDVEDHQPGRAFEAVIAGFLDVECLLRAIHRRVIGTGVEQEALGTVDTVFDRLAVVGSVHAGQVGPQQERVELIGETGLVVIDRTPRVERPRILIR